jgi:flavorubredoxin
MVEIYNGNMKNVIIIYHSVYGNTLQLAQALARNLMENNVRASMVKVEDVNLNNIAEYDTFIIGSPTHNQKEPSLIKDFLDNLKNLNLKNKKAFAFDTKLRSPLAGSAARRIEERLKKMKIKIIFPYTSAIVQTTQGPLEAGSVEKFQELATQITKLPY